jgi:hypothetical protein
LAPGWRNTLNFVALDTREKPSRLPAHNLRLQLMNDLWGSMDGNDRVEIDLQAFRNGIVRLCRPVVDQKLKLGK